METEYTNLIGTHINDNPHSEMPDHYPVIDKTGIITDIVTADTSGYVTVDYTSDGICNIGNGIMAVIPRN